MKKYIVNRKDIKYNKNDVYSEDIEFSAETPMEAAKQAASIIFPGYGMARASKPEVHSFRNYSIMQVRTYNADKDRWTFYYYAPVKRI